MRLLFVPLLMLSLIAITSAQPVVTLNYHTNPSQPSPGYFVISIDITNSGDVAKGLELSVYEEEDGFYLIDPRYGKSSSVHLQLGNLATGSTSAQLKAFAEKSGVYSLQVSLSYANETGKSFGISSVFTLLVHDSPFLFTGEKITLTPGETVEKTIEIRNMGGKIETATITLDSSIFDCTTYLAESWENGETKTVKLQISVDENAVRGTYTADLVVNYKTEFGDQGEARVPVMVEIVAEPQLDLEVKTLPDKIYANSDFTLNVAVTAKNSDLKNAVVQLQLPDGFEGENREILGDLEAEETASINFSLKSSKESGSYELVLTFSGGSFSHEYTIPVYVSDYGTISIDLAGVYTSPQRIVDGSAFKLSLQIENSGEQDVKGVAVKLHLPEGLEGRDSYFIGSLKSGDTATATFELKARKAGNHEITAEISYLDMGFEKHTVEKEFTIYVFSGEFRWVVFAVTVPIILGVIIWLYRRSKR